MGLEPTTHGLGILETFRQRTPLLGRNQGKFGKIREGGGIGKRRERGHVSRRSVVFWCWVSTVTGHIFRHKKSPPLSGTGHFVDLFSYA